MRVFSAAAIFAALIGNVSVAASETQSVLWKDVGPWTIRVVDQGKSYCEASAFWPGGTRITLGFASNKQTPHLVMSNPDWRQTERSGGYDLIVQFGSQTPWRVPSLNSTSGLDLRIEGRDLFFFEEMMGARNFGVRYGNQSVVQFEMDGAFDALVELGSCQLNVAGVRQARIADAS